MHYCGRRFTQAELDGIRYLIAANPSASRAALARYVCQYLSWVRPRGDLKEMSCRVAMLRMHDDGLIQLPPPRTTNGNGKPYLRRTIEGEPKTSPLYVPSQLFPLLQIRPVQGKKPSRLWNELMERYHYLGYAPVPGDQIRYFVELHDQVLALISFRAAVWQTAPRDRFIGWSLPERKRNLHRVINNSRFLILPWVRSKNLASRILSMTTKRIVPDWQMHYHYAPVLAETFVETPRFLGTCYQSANWICVGKTLGVGRLGDIRNPRLPVKTIWVYPLAKNFRQWLCS